MNLKKTIAVTCTMSLLVSPVYAGTTKKVSATKKVTTTKTTTKPSTTTNTAKTVASPDWQDQIIYFIMTDRFSDGNKANDNMGKGEYGNQESKYNGGDLQGVINKLDYIKGLGATSIWITPPVANQWWCGSQEGGYGGYHGYWASNFKEVDKHLGDLNKYKELVNKFHNNNMYVIQDIVCNHTGNFFTYDTSKYDSNDSTSGWSATESVPTNAPTQKPFNENNPNDAKADADKIYHFTPTIADYNDQNQAYNYQLSDLDDLNTENPTVVKALMDSYRYWIKEVGVDAYRIDTAKYVPYSFWKTFINSTDKNNLGIRNYAKTLGKNDFLTFGEVWDTSNKFVGSFTKDSSGNKLIDSTLDFPLQDTLVKVFKQGKSTNLFAKDIAERNSSNYQKPNELVTFVDNHDMVRWLNGGNIDNLKQGLAAIMTIPGIPCIYYGTEQAFTESRAAMFKEGYASGGKDHFDTNSEMYKFLQQITKVRKDNKVFSRGTVKVIKDGDSAGILAYEMTYGKQKALVVFNNSMNKKVMNNVKTDFDANTKLNLLMSTDDNEELKGLSTDKDGKLSLELQNGKFAIFLGSDEKTTSSAELSGTIENLKAGDVIAKGFKLKVKADNADKVEAIIDENPEGAVAGNGSNGEFEISLADVKRGTHSVIIKMTDKNGNVAMTDAVSFEVKVDASATAKATAQIDDPAGDDKGANGKYIYPKDSTFTDQMDILGVKAEDDNGNLKLTLKMKDITQSWSPTNKFDHVCFTIFLDDPAKTGKTIIPKQNASVPSGFNWDYEAFVGGWDNKMYDAKTSSKDSFGGNIPSAPKIDVDKDNATITLTIPNEAVGSPDNFKDWKLYVTTWDFDGMSGAFRPLMKNVEDYKFGGGKEDNSTEPLIMDDIKVITLK